MKLPMLAIITLIQISISSIGYAGDGCPDKTQACCTDVINQFQSLKDRISQMQKTNIENQNWDDVIANLLLLKGLKNEISIRGCE